MPRERFLREFISTVFLVAADRLSILGGDTQPPRSFHPRPRRCFESPLIFEPSEISATLLRRSFGVSFTPPDKRVSLTPCDPLLFSPAHPRTLRRFVKTRGDATTANNDWLLIFIFRHKARNKSLERMRAISKWSRISFLFLLKRRLNHDFYVLMSIK